MKRFKVRYLHLSLGIQVLYLNCDTWFNIVNLASMQQVYESQILSIELVEKKDSITANVRDEVLNQKNKLELKGLRPNKLEIDLDSLKVLELQLNFKVIGRVFGLNVIRSMSNTQTIIVSQDTSLPPEINIPTDGEIKL